jgi:hypothetical protein
MTHGQNLATRDQYRSRRHRAVRARTEQTSKIGKRRLRLLSADEPPLKGVERPRTRGDCEAVQRPCPFVACRYNLFLDVHGPGNIKFNFPDLEPNDMAESCALDVADEGGERLEIVAELMNITRERVRQVEEVARAKMSGRLSMFANEERGGCRMQPETERQTP